MINPAATQMPFRTLFHGDTASSTTAGLFLIRTEDEWVREWEAWMRARRPTPAVPAVDWEAELVVVLTVGTRPASGYQVTIEQLAVRDHQLHVSAWEDRNGGAALDVITHPVHAVAMPLHDLGDDLHLVQRITTSKDD
ncbi:protease complex subunit PrcB family protein [Micromonospora globispora]|uniref:protease complex subunit PrcB family protein n=1 Tax=Micromonospora globispora TaxID=1450148 RepID=UPI000F4FBFA6|nr:protease complex subunit PrcB family protein [Micromonospora globispora]